MSIHDVTEAFAAVTATITAAWAFVYVVRAVGKRIAGGGSARAAQAQQQTSLPPDFASRWERLEQSVDSLSIEVERISEAQRFTTRLLSERAAAANGARIPAAEPRRHLSPSGGGVPSA